MLDNKYPKKKRRDKFLKSQHNSITNSIPIYIDNISEMNNIDNVNLMQSEELQGNGEISIPKPAWIRVRSASPKALELKKLLKQHNLHSVCEEASCPNLAECFEKQVATFMILGDKCTRRCTFCDVGYGKPDPIDPNEPENLAKALSKMGLKYVVITSVDRDDLKDGGANHFVACIKEVRKYCPFTKVEILVPDFRKKMLIALDALSLELPDVFNHNIETVPRLYKSVRPGSDYKCSLELLKNFKKRFPNILTKSGIMLGLGETDLEVKKVLIDLRKQECDMLTIGQYLQPSKFHAPVKRYITIEQFIEFKNFGYSIGFKNVASGPLVRSSYYAEEQVIMQETKSK